MQNPRLLFAFVILIFSCTPNNDSSAPSAKIPSAPVVESPKVETTTTPKETKAHADSNSLGAILGEALGDLDKDGKEEKVIVYDTNREVDLGRERVVQVLRKKADKWILWHQSSGAVMSSESGGAMGDPFNEVSIENGCIVFYQSGGSNSKWGYVHRFRYQNDDWELIGVTTESGTPCLEWETYDYNLSTGKVAYKKEKDRCEDGEILGRSVRSSGSFIDQLESLPKMGEFDVGANKGKYSQGKVFYF